MEILKVLIFTLFSLFSCGNNAGFHEPTSLSMESMEPSLKMDTATFGAGCFWCVEAAFQQLNGVVEVKSGYSGGHSLNPTYKEVCTGNTGHAEVVQIVFDSTIITYEELLEVFFYVHDPTQLNRQGNDVGTQYRSVIFTHNTKQFNSATIAVNVADESGVWPSKIVTQVVPFISFYPAENYHDDYFNLHPEELYCSRVISPKIDKFKKKFHEKLK
jgi:peptide-methionine (S)-S-oxide reductase